jgi:hypothetical protein
MIVPALLILWVIAASVGRAAVLTRLLGPERTNLNWRGFIGVHVFRAASILALAAAYLGCAIIAGLFAGPDPNMLLVTLIFLVLFAIAVLGWLWVHWVLSLAVIYPVRDAAGTWSSVRSALQLVRKNGKELSGIAATNGTARTVAALVFTFLGLLPIPLYHVAPDLFVAIEIVIILVYCVLSDWFLLARSVGYLEVAERPRSTVPPRP